jgi:hypothetical protein
LIDFNCPGVISWETVKVEQKNPTQLFKEMLKGQKKQHDAKS